MNRLKGVRPPVTSASRRAWRDGPGALGMRVREVTSALAVGHLTHHQFSSDLIRVADGF